MASMNEIKDKLEEASRHATQVLNSCSGGIKRKAPQVNIGG